MFEKFTERARQVVVLAQEEARALQHQYIGTEHLLLGLLREREGGAARVLESLGLTAESVRGQVVRMVGRGEEVSSGQLPFTPRAKKVLELALRESLSLGHNHIGTEHILLAVIREGGDDSQGDGVAIRILRDFDADAEKVRDTVIRNLPSPAREPSVRIERDRTEESLDSVWLDGLGSGLRQLAGEIHAHLDRDPDTGDLLLALACSPGMLPAQALQALGVDLDALWGALEHARGDATRARQQAAETSEQRRRQIRELGVAKRRAIEAQEFERAAGLRDQERELVEEARLDAVNALQAEALREARRRLGIPATDRSPDHPEAS